MLMTRRLCCSTKKLDENCKISLRRVFVLETYFYIWGALSQCHRKLHTNFHLWKYIYWPQTFFTLHNGLLPLKHIKISDFFVATKSIIHRCDVFLLYYAKHNRNSPSFRPPFSFAPLHRLQYTAKRQQLIFIILIYFHSTKKHKFVLLIVVWINIAPE